MFASVLLSIISMFKYIKYIKFLTVSTALSDLTIGVENVKTVSGNVSLRVPSFISLTKISLDV